jgi:hypothetical protein
MGEQLLGYLHGKTALGAVCVDFNGVKGVSGREVVSARPDWRKQPSAVASPPPSFP